MEVGKVYRRSNWSDCKVEAILSTGDAAVVTAKESNSGQIYSWLIDKGNVHLWTEVKSKTKWYSVTYRRVETNAPCPPITSCWSKNKKDFDDMRVHPSYTILSENEIELED